MTYKDTFSRLRRDVGEVRVKESGEGGGWEGRGEGGGKRELCAHMREGREHLTSEAWIQQAAGVAVLFFCGGPISLWPQPS